MTSVAGQIEQAAVSSRRQWLALLRLCDVRQRELWGFRAARVFAVAIAAGNAFGMLALLAAKQQDAAVAIVERSLVLTSYGAGIAGGLSAARDLPSRDEHDGITHLVCQRGLDALALPLMRTVATALRVAALVGVPALLLALVCVVCSTGQAVLGRRLVLCIGVIAYALSFGGALALAARAANALTPAHGRAAFLVLLLVPRVAHEFDASIPNLFTFFELLGDRMLQAALGT